MSPPYSWALLALCYGAGRVILRCKPPHLCWRGRPEQQAEARDEKVKKADKNIGDRNFWGVIIKPNVKYEGFRKQIEQEAIWLLGSRN